MAERVEVTAEGKAALEAELKRLVEVEEPDVLAQMSAAASQGDLRENFAYHDARRELGMLRGRIAELKQTLANATVVEATKHDGRVRLGSTVVIKEEGEDDEEEYSLVSPAETGKSSRDGKALLSVAAPMGAALVGKKAGEKITVTTPTGHKLTFVVVRVE
ncbi:MAG TPA: transcription elongation factor GreA [Chloroflexia bacterium]|nr:transcription elongation factor GreA [Chloroflexia bacterium]